MTTSTRTFILFATTRKAFTQSSASVADKPEVGSSQKRIEACAATPRANVTRRRWPPEMPRTCAPPMYVSATLLSPKASSKLSMKSPTFFREGPVALCCHLRVALNSSASLTFQCAGMWSSCPTYAAMRRKSTGSLAWPLTSTSPLYCEVFFIASMSSSVDLPQPLGPMMATSWPGSKWPEHGSKMVFDSPFGKDAVNSRSLKVRLAP
mmetsp:Transcript_99270/g.266673  ORF Transcript_99270/g.266673 Transcript_99270/m.266673 type:complete len:208 (-) Transcript_99270:184-807(-)